MLFLHIHSHLCAKPEVIIDSKFMENAFISIAYLFFQLIESVQYNKSLQELSSHFAADDPTALCSLYTTLPKYKFLTV